MRAKALGLAIALFCTSALAQQESPASDPAICDAFDWSLKREQAWFAAPDLPRISSGEALPTGATVAVLALKPTAEAALPSQPTRPAKPGTFAGLLNVPAPSLPGVVQITLSDEGWIDVAQDGQGPRSPVAHTGKRNCPGLRKSLRFQLSAKPFAVTISNATSDAIKIAVAPAP